MSSNDIAYKNQIKSSKIAILKSKIYRTFAVSRKHLAWYFMLLFNNPYPIGKSSKDFKLAAFLCVAMIFNAIFGIVLLFKADCIGQFITQSIVLGLALSAALFNLINMLRLKQKVYTEKVREASEDYSLSYYATVINLAAMYPEIKLDKDVYAAWNKAWSKAQNIMPAVDYDACSLYPHVVPSNFKDFLKQILHYSSK